ncbi:SDR family NAD(P)-dependent oxidoreductase [Halosegnis longus]|uniref:Glucose 1-dehydrogenase n=1 Tax=Halosegnis longus TaxID=2216012 RepID=A0AAJ4UV45_9EURY|nr:MULTISPECIES: glucose 1-dehydrogenase [Halobacteriales]RNJ25539.1 glucose 1-dehydrogenase [Salella cibi]
MTLDMFSLDGSVAVVTGGSRGIGEAIAVAMADAGAAVVPVARSEDALDATVDRIHDAGGDAVACVGDVTDEADIERVFDTAEREFGPVDTLVNNAGTNPFFGDATDLDTETWEHIMDVNATGTFRCTREFATRVTDRDGEGSVTNIGSVGSVVGLPSQAPYTASKHAIAGMTKTLAADWAPEVRVNCLAPGYVITEFTEGVRGNDEIREELLDGIPADRFADPEEIAGTAVYLASDAAGYVTGEVHVVDGGLAAI